MKIKEKYNKIKTDIFWNNLFENSFYAFAGDTGASIINIVFIIFFVKLVGNENYGILVLAQSYMTIIDTILNLQCWKSVIQFGQDALVNNDIDRFFGYIKLGTIIDILTAIIGSIVSFILVSFIGKLLGWSSELITCAKIMSVIILSHFEGTPIAILRILNKFNLVAIQKWTSSLLKLILFLVLYIVFKKINLTQATIVFAISEIIGNFILIILSFRVLKKCHSNFSLISAKVPMDYKKFFFFTFWGTLSEVVDLPSQQLDVFIIASLGTNMVAIFKIFKQITFMLSKVTRPIQQAIMPQFSELTAKKSEEKGYNVVMRLHKAIIKAVMPIALFMGLLSPIWLKIIFGVEYAKYWYILLIYLAVEVVALSYTTIHPYFEAINKNKASFIITLISNVVYLVVAYLLVREIGMLGIIFSYVVQFSISIFMKINGIKKYLKIKTQ